METVFQASSYEPSVMAIPFVVATAVVLAMSVYLVVTDGAPILRGALMITVLATFPYTAGGALAMSAVDPTAATHLYRLGVSSLPMASAGVLMFLLALAGMLPRYRLLVGVAMASSLAFIPVCAGTDQCVSGVYQTSTGFYWFTVPVNGISQLHAMLIGGWAFLGILLVARHLRYERSEVRRRQLRGSMLAFSICVLGIVDVPLAYGYGWFPLSWLFLTAGIALALRLMIVDDLVHARALDRRVPMMFLYIVALIAGTWLIGDQLDPSVPSWLTAVFVVILFIGMRVIVGLVQVISAPLAARRDTPLDRALEQYGKRVQSLRDREQIAEATLEVIELGVGAQHVEFLTPSRDDYSWVRSDGEVLPEDETPDPLLLVWLEQNRGPVLRDDLATLRLGELREPLERLFEQHDAEIMVPLISRDEVVGLVFLGVPGEGRALRQDELRFLERLQTQAASALVYARMHRDATERVEVDKEVGLAAAVQSAFIPPSERIQRGGVTLAGAYQPASKCGGDWWSVHELPNGQVLVMVGDVTGHGIAAAMVTAAAKGCYDVAQRLMGDQIDLVRLLALLDASVRRAGASEFYMTCFATLIDPAAGKVRYANAGHVVPYVCHPGKRGMELDVLVARGDPLGAGNVEAYSEHERDIDQGDLIIWYTDGLVECCNPRRQQFGDRRMQRMLRRLDGETKDVVWVRDHVVRAAVAFQEGLAADDDITLVVGRIGSP